MTFFEMLGTLLIGPLKLIFEVIFSVALSVIGNPGLSVIVLSLAMNVLALPLYRRADAIQVEARDTENKLKDVVAHIKKTFSGDERMMILQTYYRQNNYNPLSVLSGSVSLLLEIPFFMAAYQFLSGVDAFTGASFGPITDLSAPDGLLVIGGFTINLLPIIMTLVNVISSSLYLKGFPLKTKIQLYGMAAFFLVFLYNSPSALVFYWTLNNLFSLIKTLFYRMKNPKLVLQILLGVLGVGAVAAGIVMDGFWRSAFMIVLGLVAQLPWILPLLKKLPLPKPKALQATPNKALFISGGLFLTALVGLLIPSTYISASVQEYIYPAYFYEPVWYIVYSLCIAAGTFLVWMSVFYWLANPKGKVIIERLVWTLSGVMLVNYMFFGTKLGILSPDLLYADGFTFSVSEQLINIGVVVAVFVILYLLVTKIPKRLTAILLVGAVALSGMSTINIAKTVKETSQTKVQIQSSGESTTFIPLSENGENVVVIMLDRAISAFVPYLMEENPTLLKQFDGFTFYANTMSYGGFTNFATPSLYGGYDYTPVELNLRNTETLASKHNEALKVIPTLFSQAGYNVSLIDPSYAGYRWIPNLDVFKDMPGVSAHLADGKFNSKQSLVNAVTSRKRNFFLFSLMKTLPVSLQSPVYNDGTYRAVTRKGTATNTDGVSPSFMNAYYVLENLSTMTDVTDQQNGTYAFLRSNITHEPTLLQEPDFVPSSNVDNSAYYPAEGKTITANGKSVLLKSELAISHYQANMAALIQLGNWFDELRELGVYDNTRIIVVSDHGRDLQTFDSDVRGMHNIYFYQAMLLVKDFNATGFTTVDTFMTNADVPALSLEGLVENPVNPFTGNAIVDSSKIDEKQYVIVSDKWDIFVNNGNQFLPSEWASVSGDVRDKNNWVFYPEVAPLPSDLEK